MWLLPRILLTASGPQTKPTTSRAGKGWLPINHPAMSRPDCFKNVLSCFPLITLYRAPR
jgi:hypothetical protein